MGFMTVDVDHDLLAKVLCQISPPPLQYVFVGRKSLCAAHT